MSHTVLANFLGQTKVAKLPVYGQMLILCLPGKYVGGFDVSVNVLLRVKVMKTTTNMVEEYPGIWLVIVQVLLKRKLYH